MIKSTKLLSIVKDILNKDNIQENNFLEIEDLTLNKKLLNGKENDINLKELKYFPKLKTLTIINFDINQEILNIINEKKLLWAIQFSKCNFKKIEPISKNVKYLIIDECENLDLKLINDNETIKIIGENLDLKLLNAYKTKQLYLQDCNIKNSEKILEYTNLENINLDGSKFNKDILEKIRKDIQISCKNKYYRLED